MSQLAQPYQVKVWNPCMLRISFGGGLISRGPGASGYMEGEFFKITPDGPSYTVTKGPDGTITRNGTNNRVFKAVLRLLQGSQTNDYLSSVIAADESALNGAGIGQLVAQDLFGSTIFEATLAWLIGWPEMPFGGEAQVREWTWEGQRDVINVGGEVSAFPVI